VGESGVLWEFAGRFACTHLPNRPASFFTFIMTHQDKKGIE
jgi:hypothetical protein